MTDTELLIIVLRKFPNKSAKEILEIVLDVRRTFYIEHVINNIVDMIPLNDLKFQKLTFTERKFIENVYKYSISINTITANRSKGMLRKLINQKYITVDSNGILRVVF